MADPVNKSENKGESDTKVKVDLNVAPRTWRQRGEIFGLGLLGTAAGVGLVEGVKQIVATKTVDAGLRQAASFAGSAFSSLFAR